MIASAIKVVHCRIHKPGAPPSSPEVRIIPYQEFELWKFLTTRQYGFEVSHEAVYLFLPREEFEKHEDLYARLPHLGVVRITLYFFLKADQVLVPVVRYFPLDEFDHLRPIYLNHFRAFEDRNHAAKVLEEVIEERGVCVRNLRPGEDRPGTVL